MVDTMEESHPSVIPGGVVVFESKYIYYLLGHLFSHSFV